MKHIAIVGAGISRLAAVYFLSKRPHVWLVEREPRLGGHTNTVVVGKLPLDTGFLVHNDRTYPNLVRLFREIGIESQASDMCFAVRCRRSGFEYSSRGARGFFAQKRILLRASHCASWPTSCDSIARRRRCCLGPTPPRRRSATSSSPIDSVMPFAGCTSIRWRRQYRHAREWVHRAGLDGRPHVVPKDYRTLSGRFDKIVSIEMFEAVGLNHYDDYFAAVDRLLAPDGVMLLQTITVSDQYCPGYHRSADWIEKHIFPGASLHRWAKS